MTKKHLVLELPGKSGKEYGRECRKANRVGAMFQFGIMKNTLIFFLFVVVALPAFPVSAINNPIPSKDAVGPIISIEIELGRVKRECKGIGICKVKINGLVSGGGENAPQVARATAWIENGHLQMNFDKRSIESSTFQTYFGNGDFRLEEDFTLPKEVAAALGVSGFTIKTGSYSIDESSDSNVMPVTF